MTVADTRVLLALVDETHVRHAQAKRLLEVGDITVTGLALSEMTRIIRRHANNRGQDGNAIARQALRLLRGLPAYRFAPTPAEESVAQAYEKDRVLSYADAWNLVVSVEQSEPLATFDRKLKRALGPKHET